MWDLRTNNKYDGKLHFLNWNFRRYHNKNSWRIYLLAQKITILVLPLNWSTDLKRLIQKFRGNTYFWVNIRDSLLLCVCTHAHQSSTALDSQYRLTYTHIEYILIYQLYIHMHLRCCRNNLFWTMNQRTYAKWCSDVSRSK